MAEIVELRPSRHLLNNSFETYKFSNVDTPIVGYGLSQSVFKRDIGLEQTSFLEAQIFAYQNQLFTNVYDNSCWFIDTDKQVWKFQDNDLKLMYTLQSNLIESVYNPSIGFTSNITVISNGNQTLEILIFEMDKVHNFICNDIDPGIILNVKYVEEKESLMVAMYGVIEVNSKKQSEVRLYAYSCKMNNGGINIGKLPSKQIFKADGSVEFVYIESNGNYVQIASENKVSIQTDNDEKLDSNMDLEQESGSKYRWSQDEETVTLYVKIPNELSALKENVSVTISTILFTMGDEILIEGILSKNVDSNCTTWCREEDSLKIELTKQVSGCMWNELFIGDIQGEYIPNENLAAEIHTRLSHFTTEQQQNGDNSSSIGFNSEQLEDCDFEGKRHFIQRINLNTQRETHLVITEQSNCILFSQTLENKQSVCLRHDHDGCIWLFHYGEEERLPIDHKFTFPGYGYIEASKEMKKISLCAPDGSYIALINHTQHVFIYERPTANAKIGKQRTISIDTESPILGASTFNNNLLLLTANKLYQLQIVS